MFFAANFHLLQLKEIKKKKNKSVKISIYWKPCFPETSKLLQDWASDLWKCQVSDFPLIVKRPPGPWLWSSQVIRIREKSSCERSQNFLLSVKSSWSYYSLLAQRRIFISPVLRLIPTETSYNKKTHVNTSLKSERGLMVFNWLFILEEAKKKKIPLYIPLAPKRVPF